MGGDFYMDFADDNSPDGKKVGLGDIIAYHNETTVDWLGVFGQGSYSSGPLSAYGMVGLSQIGYSYQDHFTIADEKIVADPISTLQWKGGAMYDVTDNVSVFGNFGIVEKPPIMDNVIYFDGTVASDPANEQFVSAEAGANYSARNVVVKVSAYNTDWKDRNLTKAVTSGQGSSGDTDVIFLTGINQKHKGVEVEALANLSSLVSVNASVSVGNWTFVGDADGNYQEDEYNEEGQVVGQTTTSYSYALDGLNVGDQPQTAYVAGITLKPLKGLRLQILNSIYDNNYSDWSPNAREYDGSDADADREQVWKAPGYSRMDLHATYDLPRIGGLNLQAFAHVFNALDETYVQDAVDHSQYNSYGDKVHAAHNAEVFLGIPRYYNAGITLRF
jgi:outer membrane receptor for Fe3+-dicitrate